MKKIKIKDLENANGGLSTEEGYSKCSKCGHLYTNSAAANTREIEDGCSSYNEYQCPECGTWNR